MLQVTLYTSLKLYGLTTEFHDRTLTDKSYVLHGIPYWYIEAVPELLQLASERAERSITAGGTA
jgi:hypothetical protein